MRQIALAIAACCVLTLGATAQNDNRGTSRSTRQDTSKNNNSRNSSGKTDRKEQRRNRTGDGNRNTTDTVMKSTDGYNTDWNSNTNTK